MEPFLEDIGMDIPLNKDVEKLSTFERIIVELLRAVIMGYHLIVLDEVGALVSDDELKKLHGIIRRYVKKGFLFFISVLIWKRFPVSVTDVRCLPMEESRRFWKERSCSMIRP